MSDPRLLPSACHDGIGTPDCIAFAAQYLAYTRPCQRFADCLAARPRMTLAQRGSLLLHRDGLAPSTSCLFPGAPRLNGWPARSPADASPLASRPDTHGPGLMWIATPSSYRNSHRLLLAGLPAHYQVLEGATRLGLAG